MLLIRANKKRTGGFITISTDEGQTWSTPQRLPDFISGERYKAEYDQTNGKLLVSYRETVQKRKNVYRANDWCGWYGDYYTLRSYADADSSNDLIGGDHVLFAEDFGKGDCGYSGVVYIGDGTFVCTSYGKFDKKAKNPYILSAIFKAN